MTPEDALKHYRVDEATKCWLWQGAVSSSGYGHFVHNGTTLAIHRVSYEQTYGSIPEGKRVLHYCDVRRCMSPGHLHLGTSQDNSREMVVRGRYRGPSRLDPNKVAEIRRVYARGFSQRELALVYGVSQGTVSNIVRGKHHAAVMG